MTITIKNVAVTISDCAVALLFLSAIMIFSPFPEVSAAYPLFFFSLLAHELGHAGPVYKMCKGSIDITMECFKGETYSAGVDPKSISAGKLVAFYVTGPAVGIGVSLLAFLVAMILGSAAVAIASIIIVAFHSGSLLPFKYTSDMSRLMRALELLDGKK